MPSYCAMIGCKSNAKMKQRKFFRFPMLNHRNAKTMTITQARQLEWIKALNREGFFARHHQYARVCDLHFVSGKSAHYTDVDNIDWVPTKNLGYEKFNEEPKSEPTDESKDELNEQLFTELREGLNDESTHINTTYDPSIADECGSTANECLFKEQETQTDFSNTSIGTQTDATFTGMSSEIILNKQEEIQ